MAMMEDAITINYINKETESAEKALEDIDK
jgi:hypothetical protein